jgi:hypothetical protein
MEIIKMPPPPPTKFRRFKEALRPATRYFIVVSLITMIISVVSFRRIWINDVFHIVFLGGLLWDSVVQFVRNHVV